MFMLRRGCVGVWAWMVLECHVLEGGEEFFCAFDGFGVVVGVRA